MLQMLKIVPTWTYLLDCSPFEDSRGIEIMIAFEGSLLDFTWPIQWSASSQALR